MTTAGFQYDVIADKALRKRAENQAKEIKLLIRRSGEAVVEIGKRLAEVRQSMTRSMFRNWIDVEFQWSQPTASNYMQAAKVFGDVDCLAQFQPAGIVALARRNVPQSVIEAALAKARAGEVITLAVAKGLLSQAGVQPNNSSAGKHRKPETAAAALAAATVAIDSADALRQTLDAFVLNLDQLAGDMTPDDRNAIADRFLQLAMQLREIGSAKSRKTVAARPSRRKSAAASAS